MIHCLQVIYENYEKKFAEFTSVDVLVDVNIYLIIVNSIEWFASLICSIFTLAL
jgi:hypothetical protein